MLCHTKNGGDALARMLKSAEKVKTHRRIVLIDDSTTDHTEEVCKTFGVIYNYFSWMNNFGYAKNLLTQKAVECGLQPGDWIWVIGDDWEVPGSTARNVNRFVQNRYKIVARFDVPEWHPNPIKRRWFTTRRPRLLLWRHRSDIYWEPLDLVHENMFHSFYQLTRMGNYFEKNHGIETLGRMYHFAEHEDSPEEKRYKVFKYIVLWQLGRLMKMYDYSGDPYQQMMTDVCEDVVDQEAAKLGWNYFVEHKTRRYMNGECPKKLYDLYLHCRNSKSTVLEYD
jgi:glycosyltransferase involved in cell wall biosynthesis